MIVFSYILGKSITVTQNKRDEYIRQLVPGKTFADVGGLWGVVEERISVAHRHGASELTLIDELPADSPAWQLFANRMKEHGVDNCRCLQADILTAVIGPFDVVHSAGVLYHLANPMEYLTKLRSITNQNLILASAVVPERIENRFGTMCVPTSGAVFVPALSETERSVLAEAWRTYSPKLTLMGTTDPNAHEALGVTTTYDFRIGDNAPFWWLPTAAALRSMCEVSGFRVLEQSHPPGLINCTTLLCE